MDLEIGNPDFIQKGTGADLSKTDGRGGRLGVFKTPHDEITSGKGGQLVRIIFNSSRPELFKSKHMPVNFDRFIKEKVEKHELPSPIKLLERLKKRTRELLNQLMDEDSPVKPMKYLNLLSKTLPLALTFVQSLSTKLGGNPKEKNPIDKETKESLKEKQTSTQKIPEKLIVEIKTVVKKLNHNTEIKQFKELTTLIAKMPTAAKKPVELQKLLHTVSKQIIEIKHSPTVPKGQIKILENLVKTLVTVQAFPEKNHEQVYQTLTNSKTFSHTQSPVIGPEITKFTKDIAQVIVKILPATNQSIPTKPAVEYLSKSFEQVVLSGVILGRMLVDRGDGRPVSIEDVETGKFLQLEIAKDLKIIDQFPFSLFALFTPFEQSEEDQSEIIKEAKAATMQLVRLLIRLVTMLVAIQVGGQKIGDGGVKLMLNEYREYLLSLMSDLIFSFKKISEIFGVKIKSSLESLNSAKNSLKNNDHPIFWKNIFTLFSEKSDIKNFIQEISDADPIYDAINTLISSENIDPTSFPM